MLALGQMATFDNEFYFLMVLLYLKPLFTVLGSFGLFQCTTMVFALSWYILNIKNCPILIFFLWAYWKKLRLFSVVYWIASLGFDMFVLLTCFKKNLKSLLDIKTGMQTQKQVVLNCQKFGLDEQEGFFHAYLENKRRTVLKSAL